MTPKEKAQELVNKSKDYVHGYIGSSMLTNYEYPEQILAQAKKVSTIIVDEILSLKVQNDFSDWKNNPHHWYSYEYWRQVKLEIEGMVV